MSEINKKNLPQVVIDGLEMLRKSKKHQISFLKKILNAADGKLYAPDHIIFAIINRSFAVIDGFCLLVEQKNALVAGALLRLQIDSIIRFYAVWLVEDYNVVLNTLLKGEPFRNIKSYEGKPLTDKYLCEKASEHYSWISPVYNATSKYIHLSKPAFIDVIKKIRDDGSYEMFIPSGEREWNESSMTECVEAFIEATSCILKLCKRWYDTKEFADKNPEEWTKLRDEWMAQKS